MTDPKPTPRGGFEEHMRREWDTIPEAFRDAVVDVLDSAEFVVEWLVDRGIKPEPIAVAQLTGLIMQRVPLPLDDNRPRLPEPGSRYRLPEGNQ